MLNNSFKNPQKNIFMYLITGIFMLMCSNASAELNSARWNKDWPSRNKISINAAGVIEPITNAPVLVRLHSGNFDFTTVNIDGGDIRFVAADDKTELKFYIEKFDAVNELAIIWVQLPNLNAADKDAHFWLYSGNETALTSSDIKVVKDANNVTNFHFAEKTLLTDSSGAIATGNITAQKAGLIGESAVFNSEPITLAETPAISASAGFTWSAWIKPTSLPQTAKLFKQTDQFSLMIDGQKLTLTAADKVISAGELKPAVWQHVAFTINARKAVLYINGAEVGAGDVESITAAGSIKIGEAFIGELDELTIATTARSASYIKFLVSSQGVDSALLKIAAGEGEESKEEGEGEANYLKILVDSLTLDAKIVIGILGIMFVISVWVMWSKAMLVMRTDKDNKKFLVRFQKSSAGDLLELNKGAKYPHSNLYKLYLAGLREMNKRQHADEKLSLSGASMDAIKAAIDADLVRETQRQNAGMVLLTIAISGGPFLGLLGTVVGVMITFAAIAAAGDVNVNAIAPGIAAALLATVAGLAVAIPALFGYNYLASRIKNITIAMQIFVDEFVTRSAELFGKD